MTHIKKKLLKRVPIVIRKILRASVLLYVVTFNDIVELIRYCLIVINYFFRKPCCQTAGTKGRQKHVLSLQKNLALSKKKKSRATMLLLNTV